MHPLPSPRLQAWERKYCAKTDLPPGEAFQHAFSRFLKLNRESLLDVAMSAASVQVSAGTSPEDFDPLLLKAIGGEPLQGAVNTAKGKYFEYLVAERLNQGGQVGPLLLQDGQKAVLAESMTQPGWDLQIVDEHGSVVEYLQLKATDSVGYIRSALERYPDIEILATTDVSDSGLVLDSGISDQLLREQVGEAIDGVDVPLSELFLDHFHPLLPLAAMALYEGYHLKIGAQSFDTFKLALARRGQRIVVTQLIGAAVYGLGGGLWSVPIAFAGGLAFDRTINQQAMADAYASHKERLLALRLHQQQRLMNEDGPWVS